MWYFALWQVALNIQIRHFEKKTEDKKRLVSKRRK